MGLGIGLITQFGQGACNAAGYIHEGQAGDPATGLQQALSQLQANGGQDLGVFVFQFPVEQLVQSLVFDLGQDTGGAGTDIRAAGIGAVKQSQFTNKITGIEVGEDNQSPGLSNKAYPLAHRHAGSAPFSGPCGCRSRIKSGSLRRGLWQRRYVGLGSDAWSHRYRSYSPRLYFRSGLISI